MKSGKMKSEEGEKGGLADWNEQRFGAGKEGKFEKREMLNLGRGIREVCDKGEEDFGVGQR